MLASLATVGAAGQVRDYERASGSCGRGHLTRSPQPGLHIISVPQAPAQLTAIK